MDEAMSAHHLRHWLALGCMLPLLAIAQTLADPTQPPPDLRQLAGQAPGQAEAAMSSAGPQLQSILIGTHGREVAVIDGQTVQLGGKINGAVLVKVGKNHVILKKGNQQQVLTLFPDAEIKAATPKR